MATKQEQAFIRGFQNADVITQDTAWQLNLADLHRDYGLDFNTLVVHNLSADPLLIRLDGKTTEYIPVAANGGTFGLSAEDGLIFNDVDIYNDSNLTTVDTAAYKVIVSVGRLLRAKK